MYSCTRLVTPQPPTATHSASLPPYTHRTAPTQTSLSTTSPPHGQRGRLQGLAHPADVPVFGGQPDTSTSSDDPLPRAA